MKWMIVLVIVFWVGCVNADEFHVYNSAEFEQALSDISDRVDSGIFGDDIILHEGVYRDDGFSDTSRNYELYTLKLKGTPDNPSEIKPHENDLVIFDDAHTIIETWQQYSTDVWMCNPGFFKTKYGGLGTFSMAARMVLLDDVPLAWVDDVPSLTMESRTYDEATGTLYIKSSINPNNAWVETWKGQHKSVRFRHMFGGTMEHVKIKGLEFRMFTRLFDELAFELPDLANVKMDSITWEDNQFSYGWIHLYSDTRNYLDITEPHLNWTVEGNVFNFPGREVFQVHGNDHKFEKNRVYDHGHTLSGDISKPAIINPRHCNDIDIKDNTLETHRAAIVYEMDIEQQLGNGFCAYSGSIIKDNNIVAGPSGRNIQFGQSGCKMDGIIIKENSFGVISPGTNNTKGIVFTSPINIEVKDNTFENLQQALSVSNERGGLYLEAMENDIEIEGNTMINSGVIHQRLVPYIE